MNKFKKMCSFCESVHASGSSPWHIRELTKAGKFLGGGADTLALCGRKVCWDLETEINEHHLKHCCQKCREIYEDRDLAELAELEREYENKYREDNKKPKHWWQRIFSFRTSTS